MPNISGNGNLIMRYNKIFNQGNHTCLKIYDNYCFDKQFEKNITKANKYMSSPKTSVLLDL